MVSNDVMMSRRVVGVIVRSGRKQSSMANHFLVFQLYIPLLLIQNSVLNKLKTFIIRN